jgi:phage gp29-like protein
MPSLVERIRTLAGLTPPAVETARPVAGVTVSPTAYALGAYMGGLTISTEDTIVTGLGGGSYKIYDQVLDNPQAFAAFQQRRRAVVSRPWEVEAGADDALSVAAADHMREQIAALDWDRITDRMLYANWYGFAVGECIYEQRDGKWVLADVVVPNRDRFRFDAYGGLRLIDLTAGRDVLPERKFWVLRVGATHDHAWYGLGLAHWCYWPAWFARNGQRFWSIYLEKFAMPTAVGKVPGNPDSEKWKTDRDAMLGALSAIASEAAIAVPEDFTVELLEAMRSGAGEYEKFLDRQDADIAKIILSQTMTTDNGSSRSQSETHMGVREEVTRGDSDMLSGSFMQGPVSWLTEWNFPGAVAPRVYRRMDDEEDLDSLADRDTKLDALGWRRSDDSVREVYGAVYERKEVTEAPDAPDDPEAMPLAFTADSDPVLRMVAAMESQGAAAMAAMVNPLRDALKGATDPDDARRRMVAAFAAMDDGPLAELLSRSALALGGAEAMGLDPARVV